MPILSANTATFRLMKWMMDVVRGMSYLHSMSYYDSEKKEQIRTLLIDFLLSSALSKLL